MSAASEARETRSRCARASYTPSRMASCSRVMPRCAARRERGRARQRGAPRAAASANTHLPVLLPLQQLVHLAHRLRVVHAAAMHDGAPKKCTPPFSVQAG